MRLALVGLPGSGKTTVGRQLGRRLGLPFEDSDHVIEQRLGCPIRDFFAREGEAAFRDVWESVIAEAVCCRSRTVTCAAPIGAFVVSRTVPEITV